MTYLFLTVFLFGGLGLVMAVGDAIASVYHEVVKGKAGHYVPGCDRCKADPEFDAVLEAIRAERASANRVADDAARRRSGR